MAQQRAVLPDPFGRVPVRVDDTVASLQLGERGAQRDKVAFRGERGPVRG
ncbi:MULTISPECIES: hypothetical protein [unclassified Nonomuraea]